MLILTGGPAPRNRSCPSWDARTMGRRGTPWTRAIVSAASLSVAALAGCSASAPAGSGPAATPRTTSAAPRATTAAPRGAAGIVVSGDRPVLASGSQDTNAQAAGARCDQGTFTADQAVGARVATGFAAAGFPAASALLTHFLRGTGTAVGYRAGSAIARQARASAAFQAVNRDVQAEVLGQLKAGP